MVFRLALLAVLLMPAVLCAQMDDIPAQLRWGEEQRAPNGSVLSKVIASGSWGATALRYRRGGIFTPEQFLLEQYNDRFQLVQRYELAVPEQADLEDILSLNGQLYWLISRPDEEQQVSRVYVRPLSTTGASDLYRSERGDGYRAGPSRNRTPAADDTRPVQNRA